MKTRKEIVEIIKSGKVRVRGSNNNRNGTLRDVEAYCVENGEIINLTRHMTGKVKERTSYGLFEFLYYYLTTEERKNRDQNYRTL